MIKVFWLLLGYLLPAMVGYLLLAWLDREKKLKPAYKFFAALPLGVGILTLEMFSLNLISFSFSRFSLLTLQVVNLLILEMLIWWGQRRLIYPRLSNLLSLLGRLKVGWGQKWSSERILLTVVILLVIYRVSLGLWGILNLPPSSDFDTWNNWNLRAKVIYLQKGIPLDKSNTLYLGGGIKSYPLNDPLLKVWLANVLGGWQERVINLYSLVHYLILLGLFYSSLPDFFPKKLKILGLYLLSSLPFLVFHSWVAYADLEMAVYLFLTVTALLFFFSAKDRLYLFVAGLGLAFSIWTKNEGLALVVPSLLLASLVLLSLRGWTVKNCLTFWLLALLVASPWLVYKTANQLDVLNGDSSAFKVGWYTAFWPIWFSLVFLKSHFIFLWWLFAVPFLLKLKLVWQNSYSRFLAVFLLSLFLLYNAVFLFTDRAVFYNATARSILQLAPLGILFILVLVKLVWQSSLTLFERSK